LETVKKYYRVDRKNMAFMKFIFEAYDGIATVSTVDSAAGLIMLRIPPGNEADVDMVLDDLRNDMLIEQTDTKGVAAEADA